VKKMEICDNCQQEFSRERLVLTLPWEDGNNPNAYWTCPYCGYKNIVYGYGEDD
jgi:DNA-directed RNA polymerase subunit RPC12/RpoP